MERSVRPPKKPELRNSKRRIVGSPRSGSKDRSAHELQLIIERKGGKIPVGLITSVDKVSGRHSKGKKPD